MTAASQTRAQPVAKAKHAAHTDSASAHATGLGARMQTPPAGASNQARLARRAPRAAGRPADRRETLRIGSVSDPLERDADATAARVLGMSAAPPAAPKRGPVALRRKCVACAHEEEEELRRKEAGGAPPGAAVAPAIVHDVLAGGGAPLGAAARAYFEPRFGRDFSNVRTHSGPTADASARAVGALAYTVGDHIVFAAGQSEANAPLLAHELAHVVQQERAPRALRRFAPCRHLLDAQERTPVPESRVRETLADQMAPLGAVEQELGLPGASAAPFRTEPRRGRGDVIDPQTIGDAIFGRADIAVRTGTALEIVEVKRATWTEAAFAETQLLNYISKGNRAIGEVQRIWRARGHPTDTVTSVRAMRSSRFPPESPQRIAGSAVSLAWCRDGVMSFKAIGDQDRDVFVCGVSDQGRIDAFLDRLMDPAQAEVERFISNQIEARASAAINRVTLRQAIQMLLRSPEARRLVPGAVNLAGDQAMMLALETALQPIEAQIRAIARSFLRRLVAELRRRIQAQVRALLQQSITALCVTTAELTRREIMDAFRRRMQQMTMTLIPVVAAVVASQMLAELLALIGEALLEALKYIAIAVAIVVALIALWEVAAAIAAIEGIGAALVSIGTAIARVLASLIPAFA